MSQKSELKEKLPQVINDPEIKSLTEFYFKDQGKEIRKISDQILNVSLQGKWKSLNLAQKDQDDFYSLAGILFLQILPEGKSLLECLPSTCRIQLSRNVVFPDCRRLHLPYYLLR